MSAWRLLFALIFFLLALFLFFFSTETTQKPFKPVFIPTVASVPATVLVSPTLTASINRGAVVMRYRPRATATSVPVVGRAVVASPLVNAAPPLEPVNNSVNLDDYSPFGVTVGTFSGFVAFDYQFAKFVMPDDVFIRSIGLSGLLNHKCFGFGVNFAAAPLPRRLYLEVGCMQPWQTTIDPQPFIGIGYRF